MNLSRNIMMDRVIPKNMFSSPKVRLYLIMTTVALFASGVVISTSSSDIQAAEAVQVTDYDILSKKILALETELNALKSVAEAVPVTTVALEVEELTLEEKIKEKNSLLKEEAKRLTEKHKPLAELVAMVSTQADAAAEFAAKTTSNNSNPVADSDVEEIVTVEQRILDTVMEMQAEGAIHEGEFLTSDGVWMKIGVKADKKTTWDPTIWGKISFDTETQTWVEGYVGGWVHSQPEYLDPLSDDGLNVQANLLNRAFMKGDWALWNDNTLNEFEVVFDKKYYWKNGDEGCFFYGSAGNSQLTASNCTKMIQGD